MRKFYRLCDSYKKDGEPTVLIEVLESDFKLLELEAFTSWATRKALGKRQNPWLPGPADELHLLLDHVGFNRLIEDVEGAYERFKREQK